MNFDAKVKLVSGTVEKKRKGPEFTHLQSLGIETIGNRKWSIPMVGPGELHDQQGRVITNETNGKVNTLKGIGSRRTNLKLINITRRVKTKFGELEVELPFSFEHHTEPIIGGLTKEKAELEWSNYDKLRKAELEFIKREPKLAKQLGVIRRSLFVKPIAILKPSHVIGRTAESKKLVRVAIEDVPEIAEKNLRVLVRAHAISNLRLVELNENKLSETDINEHIRKLANYYGMSLKGNELSEKEKFTLYNHMQNRVLAYYYVAHKYAKLTLNSLQPTNAAMDAKDFNGAQFMDFTTLHQSEYLGANIDESHMINVNGFIQKLLGIRSGLQGENTLKAHPLYQRITDAVKQPLWKEEITRFKPTDTRN